MKSSHNTDSLLIQCFRNILLTDLPDKVICHFKSYYYAVEGFPQLSFLPGTV